MVDYADKQTTTANTRLPYHSTMVQLEGGPERFTYGLETEEGTEDELNIEESSDIPLDY